MRRNVTGILPFLALCVLPGCTAPGGLRVEGPAPDPDAAARQVLVLDYAAQPGQRPRTLRLDEVDTVVELRWSAWGGARATATGTLILAACGEASCLKAGRSDGVPVGVALDGLVRRGDARYYRHADITPSGPARDWAVDLTDVDLPVPAP